MNITNQQIMEKAEEVFDYTVRIRRKIHMYPEVGMKEFKTASLICKELEQMGIPYRDNVGGTGVVGLIKGEGKGGTGKVIGLRADMDALTIQEKNDVPYASKIDGVMHACGHDGHVAMLLGAAKILNEMKSQFNGSVKLIFQPAEEGPGGALPMIKDGALKDPPVDAVVGIHLSSGDKTGRMGTKSGAVHAAQDEFEIIIKGVGGHAAYPHRSVDAVVLAARAVLGLQTVVSRRVDPLKPAVLTIGTINGGYRHNIIADTVTMRGTYRYLDTRLKDKLRKWTEEVLEGVTKPVGGDFEVKYVDGYPSTDNDPQLSKNVTAWLTDLLGKENIIPIDNPSMGAEDFAYFCREVPSLFLKLGSGGENGEFSNPHHHPRFDIDEKAFINGVASFVKISLEFISSA